MKERFTAIFKSKTRDEWTAVFDGTDACVVPVLSPWEAHEHPHNVARSTFIEVEGAVQPAPAPRFSRTPSAVSKPPSPPEIHSSPRSSAARFTCCRPIASMPAAPIVPS